MDSETEVDDGRYFRVGTGGGTRFSPALAEVVDSPRPAFDFKCSVVSVELTADVVVDCADVAVVVVVVVTVDDRSSDGGSGPGRFFDSLLLRVSVSVCEAAFARRFNLGGEDLTSSSSAVDTGRETGR